MVKLVDTPGSGSGAGDGVRVRIPFWALKIVETSVTYSNTKLNLFLKMHFQIGNAFFLSKEKCRYFKT